MFASPNYSFNDGTNNSSLYQIDFVCGNVGDNLSNLITNLQNEQNPLFGNFLLSQNTSTDANYSQIVNNRLVFSMKPVINSSLTITDDTEIIPKKYCDDKFNSIPNLNNLQYVDVSGSISQSLTDITNSISSITSGEVQLNGSNTWTNQNTFNSIVLSSGGTIASNSATISDVELSYLDGLSSNLQNQLNSKQSSLNSSSAINLNSINSVALTNLPNLQYLDVSGSIVSLLGTKQNNLTSSSDIELNSINGNSLTNLSNLQYLDVSGSIVSLLGTKQNNLTSSSAINLNSINSVALTNLPNLQYLDVSGSIVSSLGGKQATINSSSNLTVSGITLSSSSFSSNSAVSKSYVDSQNMNDAQLSTDNTFSGVNTFNSIVLGSGGTIASNSTTISDVELSYLDGVSSNLQTQLNSKQATINSSSNLTVNSLNSISSTTLGYIDPTSSIQTQLNSKQASLTSSSALTIGSVLLNSISENFQSISSGTNSFNLDLSTGSVFYLNSSGPTLNANFTISLRNCGTNTGVSKVATLIYSTTGKYIPSTLTAYSDNGVSQITLASSTPVYMGGNPSITTSTIMIAQFSLIRLFASNYVLCSVSSFY